MSAIGIHGIGCVSPLGADWPAVWAGLSAGKRPEVVMLPGLAGHPPLPAYRVPGPFEFRHPRLRRSSAISHFACAAASAAVAEAGPFPAGRSALVFAASDGSLIYTRKFYEEVVASGSGSPLLFPETVYNAPASHVAAVLGIDGSVLTMVGDETAGLDALDSAISLIRSGDADQCLVVASQEVDWIACDGYRRWGLASSGGMDEPILSEGAVAMVIGHARQGDVLIETTGISGGALGSDFPGVRILASRIFSGEAFAVSTLLWFACARQEILDDRARRVFVPVRGWNRSAGGVIISSSQDSVLPRS